MNKRHPHNSNLRLHHERMWQGQPVLTEKGPVIIDYLQRIDKTLWRATNDHPRTLLIRVDLRFPSHGEFSESGLITRFLASLKAQIEADLERKARSGKRVHPCHLRYVWAREQASSSHPHFHVGLLLNKDTYHCLGDFTADNGNMAVRITKALASALGISAAEARGLANFPYGGVHVLDANAVDFRFQRDRAFECLSYLAKAATKYYANYANHFGNSRL